MDRRTILFVLLCSVTFFGLNIYFSYERDKRTQELMEQQSAQAIEKQTANKAELEKRITPLSSLPIIEITSDQAGQNVIGYGIKEEDATLTLAWAVPLPETVYVNRKEQVLLTKDFVKEGVVLYGAREFQNLNIANLPDIGDFDVQLVTFKPGEKPQNFLASYSQERLFPLQGELNQNAIAVLKTESGYLPLGFYDYRSKLFVELQELPILSQIALKKPTTAPQAVKTAQKYYVLENEYMQLVFTNVGGALAEVNLPYKTKKDSHSVVKEIEFDRMITHCDPQNATFPLHPYLTAGSNDEKHGNQGGYYSLLRRGISGSKPQVISPEYYALNLVSEYPEMANLNYEVTEFTKDKIVFQANQSHRRVTKTYTLDNSPNAAPYSFNLNVTVAGPAKGLWITSGIPEVEMMSNASSPQIQYRITRKGKPEVEKLGLPKPGEVINVSSVMPDWVVNSNGYLGLIIDPLSEIASGYRAIAVNGEEVPTRLTLIDPEYQPYKAEKYPGYQVLLPLPAQGGSWDFRIYAGPFEEATLKKIDKIYSTPDYEPHYTASRSFYGWFSFISAPFAKFLFVVMEFFYYITHSWAAAIVLLTIFLRVLLYPLNAWSMKSMYRMREISPEVKAIQKKYKKEPKKAQMEIMALYREKKVNPFTGCLPIIIQIPFLIGMFDLLKSSFQLRGASFIPGWIDDLTAPDVLFRWKQPIFFIGTEFHLLPIILGVVMFFQQRLSTPQPKDVSEMTDQERQQRAMGTIMAIVFTVMFYNFPSGLNIYWLSSMILGMIQQWFTNKMMMKNQKVVKKSRR